MTITQVRTRPDLVTMAQQAYDIAAREKPEHIDIFSRNKASASAVYQATFITFPAAFKHLADTLKYYGAVQAEKWVRGLAAEYYYNVEQKQGIVAQTLSAAVNPVSEAALQLQSPSFSFAQSAPPTFTAVQEAQLPALSASSLPAIISNTFNPLSPASLFRQWWFPPVALLTVLALAGGGAWLWFRRR
jgi:hypothetical protein